MKTYKVKIVGVNTTIQNRLSRELIKEIGGVPRDKLISWEENNWEKKLYKKNIDGREEVIYPEINIQGMLREACKKYKVPPPKSVGRTWTNYFTGCVIVTEPAVLNYKDINPFGIMVNGNPSTGKKSSKVYKVRPMITGWDTELTIMDAEGYLDVDIIEEIVSTAGKFVGLSDWRPYHGRFTVKSVKEVGKDDN